MTWLTDSELTQLRLDVVETLPSTCDILRPTATNTNGYVTDAYGTAVASAPCRFDPDTLRKDVQVIAGGAADIAAYVVTLEYDTDIQDGDRLRYEGDTYNVNSLWESHSSRIVRRARVALIRGK